MNVVAVIPCLNEQRTIAAIVDQTRKHVDWVIVVDNLSTDGTTTEARLAGAEVVSCPVRGVGAATRLGTAMALAWGADIVVTLDGDGQHDPIEIPRLLSALDSADIVIGSRLLWGLPRIPPYRRLGIEIINWLINVGCRQRVSDSQSCYRAYKRYVLSAIELREDGFGYSTEILIKARRSGFSIAEVPVQCIYHDRRELNSSLNPFVHGLRVALGTLRWRWS